VIGLAVAGTLLLWLVADASAVVRRVDRVLSPLVGVAAVSAVVMTVWVGHTGADAAWDGVLDEARRPPMSATGYPAVITAADVAQRATPEACWTVVDGLVYDLTAFIARHPAGREAILEMCGRDATEDYRDEHEGQPEPAEWLAVFRIGELTR
jgi:cytochrome b involved in lipid metabolism